MITSKLTTKAQTTIPLAIRTALNLSEGDAIAYEIAADGVVTIRKAVSRAAPVDDPFATFVEWDSEADRRAYGKL